MIAFNKTKIIATIGPASANEKVVRSMIEAGMDVVRLNFSHGNHESHAKMIELVNKLNKKLGTNVGILADLQGPKIRLGEVAEDVILKEGDTIILTTKKTKGTANKLYVTYEDFAVDVGKHERILIDDGKLELVSTGSNGRDEVKAKVIYGGKVSSKKGINLPDTNISTPSLTAKDKVDLEFILTQNVHWIALSFVRSADDITKLKGMLQFRDHPAKVIAKIEKPEAVADIDNIIRATDAIMVARGDLGVEVPLQNVPIIQKEIVHKCLQACKPVIIATQMMESMMVNPSPSRAEVTDVSSAIYEGADALMLSGETAVGRHPAKVVETFSKVIKSIETQETIYNRLKETDQESETYLADSICYIACQLAAQVDAKAIIGMTKSGYTAFTLSSHRPKAFIYIFTESDELLNMVSLIWGVRAFPYHKFVSTDETINDVQNDLKARNLIRSGDIVINTGITPLNQKGRTNMVKVTRIK